ncbi:sugar MFS transporter [Flavilitoribacter nigricans]|uniref:MFS transporter n=1 Tax=Flavilitoribacter nigricans (strain ATCC 23147 / DSM 23189 / NBRC 102662 / NCIMB 1420 / SS-2) TaxID=1122177 RepID=A0A2D0MZ13_FLAN2|nr:sugar MFS transporter [Flavilitoribacter nigricans]PHN01521.1 MFS transporter [Flavilitoribacter nigricans DSM 23189 = NBRC 102662]
MKRNLFMVSLILLTFFVISFLTNIIGPLVPDIIESFDLSLTMVALLPFAFFIAYGVMSIPSGMLIERYGEKVVMVIAFFMSFLGAFLFAFNPSYGMYTVSLFLIGTGMAMLQVAINPLLRVAGGEEHFAFNSVMGQLFFGLASFLSPLAYSYLVLNLASGDGDRNFILHLLSGVVPEGLPWISLYWLFAAVSLLMVIIIGVVKFPRVELKEDEKAGAVETHLELLKKPVVWLFFLAVFCYVGTEQGVANWISEFLQTYHGYDPQTTGAKTVSWFWGLMTAGAVLGLIALKFMDSRKVLIGFTLAAVISLTVALFGPGSTALIAFPLVGFFASVMWSIIISLALNSMDKHHGSFSGILITGIAGGAVVPLIVGSLGDAIGLRGGMVFLYITLGYILSVGFWAKPLITNKTIGGKS